VTWGGGHGPRSLQCWVQLRIPWCKVSYRKNMLIWWDSNRSFYSGLWSYHVYLLFVTAKITNKETRVRRRTTRPKGSKWLQFLWLWRRKRWMTIVCVLVNTNNWLTKIYIMSFKFATTVCSSCRKNSCFTLFFKSSTIFGVMQSQYLGLCFGRLWVGLVVYACTTKLTIVTK
jgi:hypothetical protein